MSSQPSSPFVLPILCLLIALGFFSTSIYLPSFPAIGKTLHAQPEAVQFTLALFFLGSALGSLILGPIADRVGRLVIAKAGLLLFILVTFWCAESTNIHSLQIGRFFQGFAAGAGPLVSRAVGRDLYEGPALAKFSATIMMVVSLSPAIAPTLGGFIQSSLGWKYNFYFLILFASGIAIMVWKWLPETSSSLQKDTGISSALKGYIILLKDPTYVLYCLIIGLQMGSIFAYITFSPYIFISLFKFSPEEYGALGIISAFGNISGFTFARYMAHRIHFHEGILVGSFLCFLASLILLGICLLFSATALLVIIFSVCFYAASALAVVNASAAAMNLYSKIAGVAAALVGSIQIGSGFLGSSLASILPATPFALALVMTSFTILGFTISLFVALPRHPFSKT